MGAALSLALWSLMGDVLPSFWSAVSIALAFAVSLVFHEAAHAMTLAPMPAFLSVYGPVFLVGHPGVLYTNQMIRLTRLSLGRAEAVGDIHLHAAFIIAVSAPTALAIRTAEEAGMTLVALVRGDDFDIFTHPHRLITGAAKNVA